MRVRRLAPLAAAAAFAACATLTTKVHSDPAADFSRYHTFQFKTERLETDAQESLRQDVTKRLEAKGLRAVDRDPDLLVVPHLIHDQSEASQETGFGWWTGGMTSQSTTGMAVGTLAIDLVDRAKHQVVWRGEATGTVPSTGAVRREKVQIALDRIFAEYPPKNPK
ncbi:MAG TPA: DUF4136 domain-containing protein [Thermoanaerobaculia bacterium]|nr:DUF4136 domain-containing protein [Thermoanaerobaculia bacterium]